ncbi:MAG: TIGR03960 family B12-binding radical SAM protein [Syntrophales bacterium]|jgi:radical SAM family uncharacterized protein/radical SAM-linked protein|nr:TIGR03960 family B12-binding radical SAM protein [Syntrophales bacterium]MDY0043970.1 TIGR03960 family B12-binding radical SAM protein [Syntrophales bacterium]
MRHIFNDHIESLLPMVQKPARYIGGETNSVRKDPRLCRLHFALAFPDVYEIGMSHPGLQILYCILNNMPKVAAERVYAPWPDMEKMMRENGIPLFSLESHAPLNSFDVVGFSLQYELSYTNVLAMLSLGNIPIRNSDRRETDPLILAGGPCAFNPEPMAPFIDAFAIGEGEDVVIEIAETVADGTQKKRSRRAVLESLSELEGVYVPSVYNGSEKIRKRVVSDLDRSCRPDTPVVPLIRTIHDRISLEIARGCTRGCRFCQAGMVWRPVRERTPKGLIENAGQVLAATGYEEISLLSLSSGDYSSIEYLLKALMARYCEKKIALALPSLRPETLTPQLIDEIKKVRKTSFTLAPEAGTQRLRDVINKGNSEENLLKTVRLVFDSGWKSVKLYFMIGLPTETEEDLEGIADLGYKVLKEGGGRCQVTVSLSTFIPKPHTPFQWKRQIGIEEIETRQKFFREKVRHGNIKLKWHDRRMSFLEGLISRGDRKTGELIENAFLRGCRFDGWSDIFTFDNWEKAISELKIQPAQYLDERNKNNSLSWDHIDCGVEKEYLLREDEKAKSGILTEDCRFTSCTGCGACNSSIGIIKAEPPLKIDSDKLLPRLDPGIAALTPAALRIAYSKIGTARFLSHLDTQSALIRAITRSGFTFIFSAGYHPGPKISFHGATPLGIESLSEYADIQIQNQKFDPKEMAMRITDSLPSGITILSISELPNGRKSSLSKEITGFKYRISFAQEDRHSVFNDLDRKISEFLKSDLAVIRRTSRKKEQKKNVRPLVEYISCNEDALTIDMTLLFNIEGSVRPSEILTHVLEIDEAAAGRARILKKETLFKEER